MSATFGISSGSAAGLTADALAELVLACDGDTVDLRAGKGHAWEPGGLSPFTTRGLGIAFVGLSVVLGDPAHTPRDIEAAAAAWPGRPVKVFAGAEPEKAGRRLLAEQVAALAVGRAPETILVETHHGRAEPRELRDLHERHGLGVVLDVAGLAAITPDLASALSLLAPAVAAVQVKGYTLRPAGGSDHHPLTDADEAGLSEIFRSLPRRDLAVTVESRAGTPQQDLRRTRAAWSRAETRS